MPTAIEARQALAIAKAAEPATPKSTDLLDPNGRRLGEQVSVAPDDTGRDPVSGELVALSIDEISLARHDPFVGDVTVHFPRAGSCRKPGLIFSASSVSTPWCRHMPQPFARAKVRNTERW